MAGWKKVLTSGSAASVLNLTASNLTENQLVIAGSQGVLEDSGLILNGTTLQLGPNSVTSTGVNTSLTGSFTGSFVGDGSQLTGLPDSITPNSLSNGNGIESFTFNGSSPKSVTVKSDTTSGGNIVPLDVTTNGVGLDTNNLVGNGLSVTGGQLSVDYGASANQAVEGNTSLTVQGTSNEIDISGGTITLGNGGTVTIGLPNNVTIGNNLTVSNDLSVTGDLNVQGTTTTINTSNLLVEDKFILLNSGSANPDEGGLVVDEGGGSGHALFYESDAGKERWGFNQSVSSTTSTADSTAFAAAVVDADGAGHVDDAEYQKNGNIKIEGGDIWIYAN